MRHILTADLLEAMRDSLINLETLELLSPDDLDILDLRRDLKEKIAVLERQQSQRKKQGHYEMAA
jgi:hypothetical protein